VHETGLYITNAYLLYFLFFCFILFYSISVHFDTNEREFIAKKNLWAMQSAGVHQTPAEHGPQMLMQCQIPQGGSKSL
jgi:hypothetical protein